MCDENRRQRMPCMHRMKKLCYALAGLGIQIACRLIRKKKERPAGHGAGQGYPLLFASGHFAGAVVAPLLESYIRQQFPCRFFRFTAVIASQQQRHHDIFKRREFWQQVVRLEDETDGSVPE